MLEKMLRSAQQNLVNSNEGQIIVKRIHIINNQNVQFSCSADKDL